MTIIGLLIILIVLGVAGYLVNRFLPISAGFKTLINIVLIVIAILITLSAFGLLGSLNQSVPHVR